MTDEDMKTQGEWFVFCMLSAGFCVVLGGGLLAGWGGAFVGAAVWFFANALTVWHLA